MKLNRTVQGAAAVTITLISGPAIANDSVENFYKGKQVTLISAYSAGGNSALYADVVRRYIGKHIPGKPVVVVRAMPGAAGIVSTNFMAKQAPRDGSYIALTSRTAPFEPLYNNEKAEYDPRKLNWLGSANVENSVCIANAGHKVDSLEAAKAHELVIGSSAPDALDNILPTLSNELVGTKFKIVGGYPLSSDIMVAMERNEVSGFCGVSWPSLKKRYSKLLTDKKIKVLFQFALQKAPDLQDVPLIHQQAKSDDGAKVFDLLVAPQGMGRPFYTTEGVPADRLAALRKAFAETLADPEVLAEAKKVGVDIQYVSGEECQKILQDTYATPAPIVARMKKILNRK